jgi:hypothetical protein
MHERRVELGFESSASMISSDGDGEAGLTALGRISRIGIILYPIPQGEIDKSGGSITQIQATENLSSGESRSHLLTGWLLFSVDSSRKNETAAFEFAVVSRDLETGLSSPETRDFNCEHPTAAVTLIAEETRRSFEKQVHSL